ncbi:3'-5' exonuclease [Paracoccus sp. (in: a-proteobacteria)]|uniref:3'-5' exonuclease n=1 Tax=Paracoccus sp. TaxID=267 RepID=UPI00321FF5F1
MFKFLFRKKDAVTAPSASPSPTARIERQKPQELSAGAILEQLLAATPRLTSDAPRDGRGIYGLVDHTGTLCYIGSTSAKNETLYKRIHQRHRTGSESSSHYFSRMYNTGRMWRDPKDPTARADGEIAKAIRNEFIARYCRAVWVVLPDEVEIARLEREILEMAPDHAIAWNGRGMDAYEEPEALVDATIDTLSFGQSQREAIARQRMRYDARGSNAVVVTASASVSPLPTGSFRFVSLDVETANNDRSSICQIGLAFVGVNEAITTWTSYINPQTSDWSCSRIHGITARDVADAPRFADILGLLEASLASLTIYQHSGFDRSAITAACASAGLAPPDWEWRDSVRVAQVAWPELKGNGGHGLASLKAYLGLEFRHHDAGEDAKASAQIVLLAGRGYRPADKAKANHAIDPANPHITLGERNPTSPPPVPSPERQPRKQNEGQVPYAADGTCFHPGLARRGFFTIGAKGSETRHASFEEALTLLREMETPRWRRPNSAGNWGIVSGCSWADPS